MKSSLDKLQKFLKLEAERGYDNRAVLGGLGRMLERWEAEARVDALSDEFIRAVVARLRDYERLSPTARADTLQGLWRRIQREGGVSLAPLPGAGPESSEAFSELTPSETQEAAAQPASNKTNTSPGSRQEKTPAPEETGGSSRSPKKVNRRGGTAQAAATMGLEGAPAALTATTTVLPGVGPRHAQTLGRLGLFSLGDMLYYFPRRYDDYSQLKSINRLTFGEEVTVIGTVQNVYSRAVYSGKTQLVEVVISDGTGALKATWFNQPWITKRMRKGMPIVLSGKIEQYLGRLVMNNPEWEPIEQQNLSTNRIVPVYPLTANITQRWLRRLMFQVVSYWAPRVQDPLPDVICNSAGLIKLSEALQQIHFPDSWEQLKAARERLAFDEIFLLQLRVLQHKHIWELRDARKFEVENNWLTEQMSRLPYQLTNAQQNTLEEIRRDLASGHPMNRLLQGDVGSGKTIVAALAATFITHHGSQATIMAPTSILAEQHYASFRKILAEASPNNPNTPPPLKPHEIRLLIGATSESEKREILEGLANGEIKLIVGTHALIEDPVEFQDLQLVVVDEQHRFGVEQRAALRTKGENTHLLVMTATPIPRSLALTLYGDLDLSVLDELPPGRQPVDTYILYPRERERAYRLIRSQLELGKQAFIIYPLVEDKGNGTSSETSQAAVEEHERLQTKVFPNYRLGLLHGRMKPEEKETVMTNFRDKQVDILISTSVVEVGVDIPNATVMLVEGANRFGLAQLHQFRGRVGRGQDKAYCLLIADTPDSVENQRLAAMAETNDGFALAQRDLEQRGPGEFIGTRQSGISLLRLASLTDLPLIEKARDEAQKLFEADPEMKKEENSLLASALERLLQQDKQQTKGDLS